MAFTKITQQELNSRGATTLPNQPTIPAQQLKQEFDAPAKEIVAPAVNNLIDELEATSAAASIGAVAPTGRSGSTVKEVLDDISEDLSTVEGSSHSHSNKSLLDSYNQTNANLSDAVTKKHEHSNKSVLDKFSESGGKPLYDGQTIGEGDMKKSDYDSDSTVKNAGGIKAYVDARVSAAYIPAGTKTVAELLPALLIAENNNKVYNITDSGLTTEYFLEGAGKPIYPGDNVGIAYVSPNTYKFDLLAGIVDLTPYAKTADLGTAASKDSTNAVTQASTDLVESGAVFAAVNAVAQDLSDANLAITALQTASTNLGKYKAEADSIAPVELDATGASQAYEVDDQFYLIDVLLTATSPIAQNDAIIVYPTSEYNCKLADSVSKQIKDKTNKTDIARVEDGTTASAKIDKDEQFYHNNVLYTATSDIAQGGNIVTSGTGQNCVVSPKITEQIAGQEQLLQDTVGWDVGNLFDYSKFVGVNIKNGTAVFENNGITLTSTANDCYNWSRKVSNEYGTDGVIPWAVSVSEGDKIKLSWDYEVGDAYGQVYLFPNGVSTGLVVKTITGKSIEYIVPSGVTFVSFRFGVQEANKTSHYKNIVLRHFTVDEQKADNSVIAPVENGSTASQAYAVGEHFIRDGAFCTCKQAISQGGSFTLNTNYTSGNVAKCLDSLGRAGITVSNLDNVPLGFGVIGLLSAVSPSSSNLEVPYICIGAVGVDRRTLIVTRPATSDVYICDRNNSVWSAWRSFVTQSI